MAVGERKEHFTTTRSKEQNYYFLNDGVEKDEKSLRKTFVNTCFSMVAALPIEIKIDIQWSPCT